MKQAPFLIFMPEKTRDVANGDDLVSDGQREG